MLSFIGRIREHYEYVIDVELNHVKSKAFYIFDKKFYTYEQKQYCWVFWERFVFFLHEYIREYLDYN